MNARLRMIYSTDVEDLDKWAPSDQDFGLPIRMIIGPSDGPGQESFDVTVCTGGWLEEQAERVAVYDARHHLVVRRFNWATIREYLEYRVQQCAGDSWEAVAQELSKLAYWEFEGY